MRTRVGGGGGATERVTQTWGLFFLKTDRTWMAGGLARPGQGDTGKLLSRAQAWNI